MRTYNNELLELDLPVQTQLRSDLSKLSHMKSLPISHAKCIIGTEAKSGACDEPIASKSSFDGRSMNNVTEAHRLAR